MPPFWRLKLRGVYGNFGKFIHPWITYIFPPNSATAPIRPGPPHYRGFTIILRHTTVSRTPLDEWPARRRDLYLTTHNTQNRQTSMPPAGFESTIPASERPQTHASDRAATGIGMNHVYKPNNFNPVSSIHPNTHNHKWPPTNGVVLSFATRDEQFYGTISVDLILKKTELT
jgi:hypothetical protein